MIDALHAEWTKLRTLRQTAYLTLSIVVLTIGLSVLVCSAIHVGAGGGSGQEDPTKLSLVGVYLGQAVVVVLGVMAVSDEYGTGMIRTTLVAIPRRGILLLTKAFGVTGIALVTGIVAVLGCLLAGRLLLPHAGLDPANGYSLISLAHGATLRAVIGTVLYLMLIGLLGLGVATALRDTAVSIGAVLALLYLMPIISSVVQGSARRHLEQIAPMTAGLAIQATTNYRSLPISPWTGLGVLALWSAGALAVGGIRLRFANA